MDFLNIRSRNKIQPNFFMLCNVAKKERAKTFYREEKIYAARDFSDKYDHALFKYPIKFVKFLIISSKKLNKF
jgi:hypothetical protein